MTTRLIVARHGNTFAPGAIVTRVGGRTDLPLVASGLEQGRMLGLHLKEQGLIPEVVFTATLVRTRQTAAQALLAMELHRPCIALTMFDEIDYGPDENKPEADVLARLGPDTIKAWDEAGIVPPGWNADADAIIQAWLTFGQGLRNDWPDKTVLVVTSNGIARFSPYLTGDFEAFRREHNLKIATGAYALFSAQEGGPWLAEAWNVRPGGR